MHGYENITQASDEAAAPASTHPGGESSGEQHPENFSRNESVEYVAHAQVRNVTKRRVWGLFWTVLLAILIFVILLVWEHSGHVPTSQKILFNFLSTVFSIALGLSFSVGFTTAIILSGNTDRPVF